MGRKIKFSLLYRDMWQSSGKYVPRLDQLEQVAPHIVDMGCFARVETNGGGFEQINLLFGENPNKAVRAWTKPFKDAGIQTHMLERALNGIRMSPVPADVRRLMFKVKKLQGTDIARSRSEEHTSELQSRPHLVCRLLLEKKKNILLFLCTP